VWNDLISRKNEDSEINFKTFLMFLVGCTSLAFLGKRYRYIH